jgi:nitric oxide synthase oxygenase domain/subunit
MKLFLSVILTLLTLQSTANTGIYKVDEEDNLDTIVREKLDQDGLGEKDYGVVKYQIERYNPNIKDWNHLKEGTQIFLAPPLTPAISNFAHAYFIKACEQNRELYKGESSVNNQDCPKDY